MSPEVLAALYGALAGGGLVAIALTAGAFLGHHLPKRKKVRCVASGWDTTVQEAGPLSRAVCSFDVYLFNEKPSPTGLRDVRVAVLPRGGEQPATVPLRSSASDEEVKVLNLPPRQWVYARLYALLEGEYAQGLADHLRRADLVADFPDDAPFRRKIVERKDFVVRKKKRADRKDYARSPLRALLPDSFR